MAHSFHTQDWRPSRLRGMRLAGQAAELLVLLTLAALVALWVTGAPIASLLPTHPPA
jgi:hypothetical protein